MESNGTHVLKRSNSGNVGIRKIRQRKGTSSNRGSQSLSIRKMKRTAMILCAVSSTVLLLLVWFSFLWDLVQQDGGVHLLHRLRLNQLHKQQTALELQSQSQLNPWQSNANANANANVGIRCEFREYPAHRHYHLNDKMEVQPDFLSKADYIFGKLPIVLREHDPPTKLCVDQSEWLPARKYNDDGKLQLPFADGTNPSVLRLDRLKLEAPTVHRFFRQHFPTVRYICTICMTNSQCLFSGINVNNGEQQEPDTVRTLLQFLDASFQKVAEATIYLKRDAPWGAVLRKPKDKLYRPQLDDARLFLYDGLMYVSFREGPGWGYERQVLNPIRLAVISNANTSTNAFTAQIVASESAVFGGGRNMALMNIDTPGNTGASVNSNNKSKNLYSLTWVDPVTVVQVDTTPKIQRPVVDQEEVKRMRQRKIAENQRKRMLDPPPVEPKKSHVHGTNAFMVPIPGNRYLGVAHFHRPSDRLPNSYARFGHHYTHAFYAIAADGNSDATPPSPDGTNSWRLVGLSQEFVLPTAAAASHKVADDAEIIQFVSGLEYDDVTGEVILAYGINDCEGAITTVDFDVVDGMMRPIPPGKQVVDYMEPLLWQPQQ